MKNIVKKTPYPINVGLNNYHKVRKSNIIETLPSLSHFITNLLIDHKINEVHDIGCGRGILSYFFGIAGKPCIGYDSLDFKKEYHSTFIQGDFLREGTILHVDKKHRNDLIVCNPPFNYADGKVPDSVKDMMKDYGFKMKPLLPLMFLLKIFEIWGIKARVVLFIPMGFLYNQRQLSKGYSERYTYLMNMKSKITSIITIPMNAWNSREEWSKFNEKVARIKQKAREMIGGNPDSWTKKEIKKLQVKTGMTIVHSTVLLFNIRGLQPHYMADI